VTIDRRRVRISFGKSNGKYYSKDDGDKNEGYNDAPFNVLLPLDSLFVNNTAVVSSLGLGVVDFSFASFQRLSVNRLVVQGTH
jgi:hypothetical protein